MMLWNSRAFQKNPFILSWGNKMTIWKTLPVDWEMINMLHKLHNFFYHSTYINRHRKHSFIVFSNIIIFLCRLLYRLCNNIWRHLEKYYQFSYFLLESIICVLETCLMPYFKAVVLYCIKQQSY